MERSAKGLRVGGGLLILLNIVAFFLPLTQRTQNNYATLKWSQFDYIKNMFQKSLPHGTETAQPIATGQIVFIISLMIIPIILVLVAGIWGMVGNSKQIWSSILIFVILAAYIALAALVGRLWPAAENGQEYHRGIACMASVIVSGCSGIVSIIALIATPGKNPKVSREIPEVETIKQEKIEARYNIIQEGADDLSQQTIPQTPQTPQEVSQEMSQPQMQQQAQPQTPQQAQPQIPDYVPGTARGVWLGLTGIYAGAEIPFADGESIKLGRLTDNDLIYENQPKVSRHHCTISWDVSRKKFKFRDFSSNGSFVNGSDECVPQNIDLWLEPGTEVSLGDDTNRFRLE